MAAKTKHSCSQGGFIRSHVHFGFGLRWLADTELPDLPISNGCGPPDVELCVKAWPAELTADNEALVWQSDQDTCSSGLKVFLVAKGEFFLFRYGDGTEFLLHHSGSKVWCRWKPEFSLEYAATYLYGPILGFLLRLRGVVCLHAGVAVIDTVAVGFIGPSGAGKSTLCAALAERGYPVISDDILALTERDGELYAIPTYPRVRLWPESASALFGSADALRPITKGWEKRHLDLSEDRFESEVRPLGAIYFLSERSNEVPSERIVPLNGARKLSSLLANVYAYRIFDKEMREREFKVLSQLASRTPLRTIVPFDDLSEIGKLCQLICADLGALLPQQEVTTLGR